MKGNKYRIDLLFKTAFTIKYRTSKGINVFFEEGGFYIVAKNMENFNYLVCKLSDDSKNRKIDVNFISILLKRNDLEKFIGDLLRVNIFVKKHCIMRAELREELPDIFR
ncbi:hypothetical protein ACFL5P_01160 [candidate division KSB1 bacterium]